MNNADKVSLKSVSQDIGWLVIAPNKKSAMIQHLEEGYQDHDTLKIIFNPGQQTSNFTGAELESCLQKSDYLILNEYEYNELLEKIDNKNVLQFVEKVIVTLGEN
jgi:sugar/nucleoside kinase (ribokinase family)